MGVCSYPCHLDPAVQHLGSLGVFERPLAQAGEDHAVRHTVELTDGGADGGRQMFLPFLIPLRPDAAQTMIRDHFLKQLLYERIKKGGGLSEK